MTRIAEILAKARRELSDVDGDRWSDTTLLSHFSDAQEDLVNKTNCLYRTITISTLANKNTYVLPDDVRMIDKVSYDGTSLKFISRAAIERLDTGWRESIGNPVYAVFDRANRGNLKISPVPEDAVNIEVSYSAFPSPIISTDSELSLGKSYNQAFFYYIVARALESDFDAQDIGVSSRYSLKYGEELRRLGAESSKDFLHTNEPFTIPYVGFAE